MASIYHQNISIQNKLDHITLKPGDYHQLKVKSKNYNKTPLSEIKGSLNYAAKKKEAMRIDQENIKMAKRIVSSKACIT
jgi:hypothetical protein